MATSWLVQLKKECMQLKSTSRQFLDRSIFFFSYNVCVLFCYQGIYGLLKILKLFPPFLFIYFINLLKRISFDFIFSIFFCFEFQCLLFFIIFFHLFDIGLIFSSSLLKWGLRLLIWYLLSSKR